MYQQTGRGRPWTYLSNIPPPPHLSLSLILPLFPFLSLFAPTSPHFLSHFHSPRYGSPSATLCLLCIRRRRETNSYLFMSFRFILARPLRKKKNRSRNNLERRDIHIIEKLLHEDILSRSISLYFQCNYIIVYLLSKISPPPPSIRFDNYILREKKIPVREKKSGSRYVGVRKKKRTTGKRWKTALLRGEEASACIHHVSTV